MALQKPPGNCLGRFSTTYWARFAVVGALALFAAVQNARPQTGDSSGQTVKYTDLLAGRKLPYGKSVTITGSLTDFGCGKQALSELLEVSAIAASYLGQSGTPIIGSVTGQTWAAPLGQLPPDTAINLQIKVTGTIAPKRRADIIGDLAASDDFRRSLGVFFQMTRGEGPSGITLETNRLMQSLSGNDGALRQIFQRRLPCVAAADVTAAATAELTKNLGTFVNVFNADLKDLSAPGSAINGVSPQTPLAQIYQRLKTLSTDDDYKKAGLDTPAHIESARSVVSKFIEDYENMTRNLGLEVVSQSSVGVLLDSQSSTADLNKYAGFDVGVNYVPRIDELRRFYVMHVYPFGPVELSGGGLFTGNWRASFSIAVGLSTGDFSGNANSRVKGENAFVYGLGIRLNKFFRLSVGGMIYRDALGNRLLNEAFIGPSIDITALPGLKQVFSSSSGTSTSATAQDKTTGGK